MTSHNQRGTHSYKDGEATYWLPEHRTGWMNYRTATNLDIVENVAAYLITTRLPGLLMDNIRVEIRHDYLYVEGQVRWDLNGPPQYGRYVRPLKLSHPIDPQGVTFVYQADSYLVVHAPKYQPEGLISPEIP